MGAGGGYVRAMHAPLTLLYPPPPPSPSSRAQLLMHMDSNSGARQRAGVAPGTWLRLISTQVRGQGARGSAPRPSSTPLPPPCPPHPARCGWTPCKCTHGPPAHSLHVCQGSVHVTVAHAAVASLVTNAAEWADLGGERGRALVRRHLARGTAEGNAVQVGRPQQLDPCG
jgi:hypothetical protein